MHSPSVDESSRPLVLTINPLVVASIQYLSSRKKRSYAVPSPAWVPRPIIPRTDAFPNNARLRIDFFVVNVMLY